MDSICPSDGRKKKRKCHGKPKPKERFRALRVKLPVVVAETCVQKVGDLDVPVPTGVPIRPDGLLAAEPRVEPAGPVVVTTTVLKGKILNEGHVPVDLIIEKPDPNPCPDVRSDLRRRFMVPFQALVELPKVRPGDRVQEEIVVEFAGVSIRPAPSPQGVSGPSLLLHIKVILKAKIIVERDKLLKVLAC